jgi:glycosyltransferase involved in cell wall biosynthesis
VLVSVVIPAYESAGYIPQALDSVFAQTFSDFEVILVNDGSPDTDLLEQNLRPYAGRIHYVRQKNQGPSGARNTAILQARGKYVAFLDGDDMWLPQHLANQTSLLLSNPSLGLVYADAILLRGDAPIGHAFGQQPQSPRVTFESLVVEDSAIGTSSVVALRQALIDAGLFDQRFKRCEDFDLWLRMSFRGTPMDYCRAKGLYHRVSEKGLSSNRIRMGQALIEVYEKTASTLPLSAGQSKLIRQRIEKIRTACQTELVKELLDAGDYERALDTARHTRASERNWKLALTVVGLRSAPRLFRYCHRVYERILRRRSRIAPQVPHVT